MTSIRFGIIGIGIHGLRYAGHLRRGEVEGADLAVVCRRDRDRGEAAARDLGVPFRDDYRQVLADRLVDAVAIAVPCNLHPLLVPEALEAGKAVLVEKPLAADPEGAGRIVEASRRHAPIAMVAQTLRFNSVIRLLREKKETIGRLRFVSLSQRFEPSEREWLDDPEAGGVLRNTGVHSFDLLRHLTGLEAEEATCFSSRGPGKRMEDSFGAVLRLSGDVLATVDNTRTTASRIGRVELAGERGQLAADHIHHRLVEIRGGERREIAVPPPVPTVRQCLAAFTAAIRGEIPIPVPLTEGLRAVEIVEACRKSAATGAPCAVEKAGGET